MSERFVVSARKYRPSVFNTVIGQTHVTRILKNAIRTNHIAQAFLFCGPRGVGKTTCARILAKTLNCTNLQADIEPCNECDSCKTFINGSNVNIMELDAASNNSVDGIRTLVEQVRYAPQGGKYKVYIIDEVHMLSTAAFNAFLKTLEEPPSYVIFILATTEKHKILPTILSRCQIFDFNRITSRDTVGHLKEIAKAENVACDEEVYHLIAQKADGGMRDALSIFDQLVTLSDSKITYKEAIEHLNLIDIQHYFGVLDGIAARDLPAVLQIVHSVLSEGFEGLYFLLQLAEHARNLLVARDPRTVKLLPVSDSLYGQFEEQASRISVSTLLSILQVLTASEAEFKQSKNQQLYLEVLLMKLCFIQDAFTPPNAVVVQNLTPTAVIPKNTEAVGVPVGYVQTQAPVVKTIQEPNRGVIGYQSGGLGLAGISGLSLDAVRKKALQQQADKTEAQLGEQKPLLHEEIVACIKLHLQENESTISKLYNTMLSECEHRIDGDQRIVFVLSDAVKSARFEEEKMPLLLRMRNHFGIPNLTFTIDLRPDAVVTSQRAMTKSELLRHFVTEMPEFAAFREILDLDVR